MQVDSKTRNMLHRAKYLFMDKKYDAAMRLWSDALALNPSNKEAKVGVLLCDIASENEEQSAKIFEYYQILKAQKSQNAEDDIIKLVEILDKNSDHFVSLVSDFEEAQVNDIDGILYSDFKQLINEQNDFKKLFSYAMFSTKIVFVKKSDFYEFLNLLIDNDLGDISMRYIETLKGDIIYDDEMQKILKRALNAKD